MKTFKLWLLLGLVFFAGVFFGVVGTRLAVRRMVHEAMLHPARLQAAIERRLTHKLSLDASQQIKLDGILSDTRQHLEVIRHEIRPEVTLVFSNANQQISAILTPDQLVRYQKIKEENADFLRAGRAGQ